MITTKQATQHGNTGTERVLCDNKTLKRDAVRCIKTTQFLDRCKYANKVKERLERSGWEFLQRGKTRLAIPENGEKDWRNVEYIWFPRWFTEMLGEVMEGLDYFGDFYAVITYIAENGNQRGKRIESKSFVIVGSDLAQSLKDQFQYLIVLHNKPRVEEDKIQKSTTFRVLLLYTGWKEVTFLDLIWIIVPYWNVVPVTGTFKDYSKLCKANKDFFFDWDDKIVKYLEVYLREFFCTQQTFW